MIFLGFAAGCLVQDLGKDNATDNELRGMMNYETLTEALEANRRGGQGITFLDGGRDETISYRTLYDRALHLLGALQHTGLKPGDELLLMVDSSVQCVDVLWACLLGGIVPVPIGVGIGNPQRQRLYSVFPRLKRPYVYVDRAELKRLGGFAERHGLGSVYASLQHKAIVFDEFDARHGAGEPHSVRADDVALIQFSSGATAEPRGVVLTHRNLLINIAGIAEAAEMRSTDSTLSWMPLTHDMGLIGFHLAPLVLDLNAWHMATELFIRRPLAWMHYAAHSRASLLCSPNFGYQHFLKAFHADALDGINLSGVRLIFNGAEPISADLCERFQTSLEPFGLKRNAIFPVYGLAEASLAVSFPRVGEPVRVYHIDRRALRPDEAVTFVDETDGDGLRLVSVGRPVRGCRLRVADHNNEILPEACLGRIQIAGANVTGGYYQDAAADNENFTPDDWFDTGDMGFITDGELIVAGRAKEMIIVNGQNYYPHDIERVIGQSAQIGTGRVAACGLRSAAAASESLVIFCVFRGPLADFIPLIDIIRHEAREGFGLEPACVLPLTKLPKTTSGKIERYQLVRAYQRGEFRAVQQEVQRLERACAARHAQSLAPVAPGNDSIVSVSEDEA